MDALSYEWIERSDLCVAGCVTVVLGTELRRAVSAFGGDPTVPPRPRTDRWELPFSTMLATVVEIAPGVVVLEWNGSFEGTRIEVLREASARGLAVSVWWNVNARMTFSLAVAGELVTGFDPMFPDLRWGREPDRLIDLMTDLPFGSSGQPIPAAMALAERVTGVALPEAEIEKIDDEVEAFEDVWILTPVLSDLPSVDVARRMLAQSEPQLDVLIETAPRDRWRPLAAAVARAAAASCGLTDDARIARTLAMLESSPGAPMPEEAAELVRQLSAQATALRDEEAANPERAIVKSCG